MPVPLTTAKRWRAGRILTVTAAALATGMILTAVLALTWPPAHRGDTHRVVDLAGNSVQFDGPPPAPEASAQPTGYGRLEAPSVGLDVPLGALDVVDDVIEPPGFTSAYWVRNLGVAPSAARTGTVFVAMHSLRGGGVGPGNALIDVAHARARIALGATITVDGVAYRVSGTEVIGKGAIGSDSSIWADVPGRLVVVTCLQRPDGRASVDNVVVVATRA